MPYTLNHNYVFAANAIADSGFRVDEGWKMFELVVTTIFAVPHTEVKWLLRPEDCNMQVPRGSPEMVL